MMIQETIRVTIINSINIYLDIYIELPFIFFFLKNTKKNRTNSNNLMMNSMNH